jgi:hypothetical protein
MNEQENRLPGLGDSVYYLTKAILRQTVLALGVIFRVTRGLSVLSARLELISSSTASIIAEINWWIKMKIIFALLLPLFF